MTTMEQPWQDTRAHTAPGDNFSKVTDVPPPELHGEYASVRTLDLDTYHTSRFRNKFGSIALHTMNVEVVREYDDRRRPRTTWYEVMAAERTDSDAPDQNKYPLVNYSNALLTTARTPGTATNRYFLNPVYEGFSAVNVSVKKKPNHGPIDFIKRGVPHTIPLSEMADDELVVTDHIAEEMNLGQAPDMYGIRHINKSGYSRGVQLSIVEAARAPLHGMVIDRLQGRGPGPIHQVGTLKVGGSIRKEGKEDLKAVGRQLWDDPFHAPKNLLNIISSHPDELISYIGDASSLLQGTVARSMAHLNPDLRGFATVFSNDAFGRDKDYSVFFEQQAGTTEEELEEIVRNTYFCLVARSFRLIRRKGAHLSGMDQSEVKLDRLEWAAERDYLDGKSDNSASYRLK